MINVGYEIRVWAENAMGVQVKLTEGVVERIGGGIITITNSIGHKSFCLAHVILENINEFPGDMYFGCSKDFKNNYYPARPHSLLPEEL